MRFTKLHGSGNDFIVVDAREVHRDWSKLAAALCDRHFGAGADGLLTVKASSKAQLGMGLYNADGSEAELSGNGMRCFVKYAVERGLVAPADGSVAVDTLAGVIGAQVTLDGDCVSSVRVGMGKPRLTPQEIPVAIEAQPPLLDVPVEVDGSTLRVACVSMGNPHAVLLQEQPVDAYPLSTIGPSVEHYPLFPARVNFEVARVLSRERIEARTWERGVGETLACGTGCCAVMVAAQLRGFVGERVEVQERGGVLLLEWDGRGDVFLSGPAAEVYEGEWPD